MESVQKVFVCFVPSWLAIKTSDTRITMSVCDLLELMNIMCSKHRNKEAQLSHMHMYSHIVISNRVSVWGGGNKM